MSRRSNRINGATHIREAVLLLAAGRTDGPRGTMDFEFGSVRVRLFRPPPDTDAPAIIDVWQKNPEGGASKVLNIHWREERPPMVVYYRPGDWKNVFYRGAKRR
jgi:hypothetical protein